MGLATAAGNWEPDDLVPSLLIRDAWNKWAERSTQKAGGHLKGWAARGVQVIFVFLALQIWDVALFATLALPLLVALFGLGFWRAYRLYSRRDDQIHHRLDARALACLVCAWATVSVTLLALHVPFVSCAWSLIGMECLARMPTKGDQRSMWAATRMSRAMVRAGVYGMDKDKEGRPRVPTLQPRGRVRSEDYGQVQGYSLPEGVTWERVIERQKNLASAMGVPPELLMISHEYGTKAGDVDITVLKPMPLALQPMEVVEGHDFTEGVPVGRDRMGRMRVFKTTLHTMLVGGTGAGKTRAACWIFAWAARDPRVRLFIIDGKDDQKDWRPAEPLCEAYVGGATRHTLPEVKRVLELIESMVVERSKTADRSPVFVVIDEWARIRSAAKRHAKTLNDPTLQADLDGLLMDLCATARSFGIRFLVIGQRGTAEFFPTDMRANLVQRFVGRVAEDCEAQYVFDRMPDVLPVHFGHFLMAEDGSRDISIVQFPDFPEDEFAALCESALELRAANPLPRLAAPSLSLVKEEAKVAETVEDYVLEILRGGPAMTASEILPDLPERLAPPDPQRLGFILGGMQRRGLLKKKTCPDGKTPGWALAA